MTPWSDLHKLSIVVFFESLMKGNVTTSAQLHSIKPELWLSIGSNPARVVLEICNGDNLWKIRLNAFRRSTNQKKAIYHHHHLHHYHHHHHIFGLFSKLIQRSEIGVRNFQQNFPYAILYQLTTFHYQTFLTFQDM